MNSRLGPGLGGLGADPGASQAHGRSLEFLWTEFLWTGFLWTGFLWMGLASVGNVSCCSSGRVPVSPVPPWHTWLESGMGLPARLSFAGKRHKTWELFQVGFQDFLQPHPTASPARAQLNPSSSKAWGVLGIPDSIGMGAQGSGYHDPCVHAGIPSASPAGKHDLQHLGEHH